MVQIENCGVVTIKVDSLEKLYEEFYCFKNSFIGEKNNGVTTFFYSCILTKGVTNI